MNCPEKKHILLITTGGTIASMPGGQGLEPRRSDVLERELNQLRTYYHISIQDLMCLDSSNIQPEEWVIIARAIFEAREDYDGIVVSHGTDTMAYTASMATFMLENINLPVVFTGSQLPLPVRRCPIRERAPKGRMSQHLMDTGRRICCPGILPPIPMQSSRGPGFRCRIGLRLLLPPRPTPA